MVAGGRVREKGGERRIVALAHFAGRRYYPSEEKSAARGRSGGGGEGNHTGVVVLLLGDACGNQKTDVRHKTEDEGRANVYLSVRLYILIS